MIDNFAQDELQEILEEMKYVDLDWIQMQEVNEDLIYSYSGEDNILLLISSVLARRLRKYYKGEKIAWMIYDGRVWRETHTDYARSTFLEATKRVATYCNSVVKRIERDAVMTEQDAAITVAQQFEELTGDALRDKIREYRFGERGFALWRNSHRVQDFIQKKLLSVQGRQYNYLFRRFTDDISFCEPIFPEQLDNGTYLNFLNGTLDINNPTELLDHDMEHYITRIARAPYVAEPPLNDLFEQWIDNIPPGDLLWLQVFYGQAVSGANTEKVFLSMIDNGDGNSGKSATTFPLFLCFGVHPGGGYISPGLQTSFSPGSFSNPGAPREDLVTLMKSHIIIIPESRRGPISGELVKAFVSGNFDFLGYRGNYSSIEGLVNKATLIFVGNQLPIFDQTDKALDNRHFMMEFSPIPEDQQDKRFAKKLKDDMGFRISFVSWVVRGLKTFLRDEKGLTSKDSTIIPIQGQQAKARSAVRDNILDEWMRDATESRKSGRTTAKLLYDANHFARLKGGERKIKYTTFKDHLELYIAARSREEEWLSYNRRSGLVKGLDLLPENVGLF